VISSTFKFDASLCRSSSALAASRFALAAFAKLTAGRTVDAVAFGSFGEAGVGGVFATAGGGVLVRKDALREFVREMGWDERRSLTFSRSFSRRSATSFSRVDTSTGFAAPNGFDRELAVAFAILGDERGLGLADPLLDLGINSSLRRVSEGVGGVELLGDVLPRATGLGREELRQSLSPSAAEGITASLAGAISDLLLNPLPNLLPALSSLVDGVNLLPLDHFSSVSAIPTCPSGVANPGPLLLAVGGSKSGPVDDRNGRLDRH